MSIKNRVLIVGAGPGGLASAILLAHAGFQVEILERLDRVGGRTSAIEAEGFRFDLGPTFFLYPEVLDEIFASAGYDLRQEVELVRLDPQYRLIFGGGGGDLRATPDAARMRNAIAGICPADAVGFDRFMAENREKFARFKPCLQMPYLGLRDVTSTRMLGLLPMLRPWNSVDDELRRYFSDPRVRLAFSFQSKYLGMSPFKCPGLFSILSYIEYEFGVFHPIGGCNAVTQAMARVAREMGVTIRLNEPVTRIDFEGRRAVGLQTPNGDYRADAIVINADFARAMEGLIPDKLRRRWTNKRLERKKYSCSTFMLYLGVEGRYDVPHHNIYLAEDYLSNLADIEDRHLLSKDPSVYVQNACITDPSLAPKAMSTLYVLAPVTHQHPNVDWAREREAFRKCVMGQLPKMGIGGIENRIRFERVITPADWEKDHAIYRGATFNLAHNLGQLLHLRPRNRFEDVDGVYLTGGGTHPGSGLPVIFESARIAAKLIGQDLGINVPVGTAPRRTAQAPAMAGT